MQDVSSVNLERDRRHNILTDAISCCIILEMKMSMERDVGSASAAFHLGVFPLAWSISEPITLSPKQNKSALRSVDLLYLLAYYTCIMQPVRQPLLHPSKTDMQDSTPSFGFQRGKIYDLALPEAELAFSVPAHSCLSRFARDEYVIFTRALPSENNWSGDAGLLGVGSTRAWSP